MHYSIEVWDRIYVKWFDAIETASKINSKTQQKQLVF